ncbi:MAG: ribose 5-phosphate isomerase B [Planctomycetota bacterium]
MKIAIASDHAGYALKEKVKDLLSKQGVEVTDFGTNNAVDPVDYPDYGRPAAKSVAQGRHDRAVLVCGTGLGMSLTANRLKGVRGTLCHNAFTAEMARKHNDSNVLILGARVTNDAEAAKIVQIWLDTPFEGGRHKRRIDKIEE